MSLSMKCLFAILFASAVLAAQPSIRPKQHRLPTLSFYETKPISKNGLRAQGVARPIPETHRRGEWTGSSEGGKVWRLALTSPEAWGLRIHFRDFHVGHGKVFVFRDEASRAKGEVAGPYSGDGPLGDREFWAEPVAGDTIIVEYVPENAAPRKAPFRLEELMHLYAPAVSRPKVEMSNDTITITGGPSETDPEARDLNLLSSGVQSRCSPDVSCYAAWSQQSKAVASISFIQDGYSYACTGSLIADPSGGGQPFFLTANHCISSDTAARTVVAYFQYEAATCGAAPPDYFQVPRVTGARYLVSRPIAQGDFSLMQLASAAPSGSVPLELAANPEPAIGEQVVGIHHPGRVEGGMQEPNSKRISFGARQSPAPVNVEGTIVPSDTTFIVDWLPGQGYTEPGSSGSPLFSQNGKLIGVLSAGAEENYIAPCNPAIAVGIYGKLSAAMSVLSPYLGCSFSIAGQPMQAISAAGGSFNITLSGRADCSWTASSNASWMRVSGASSGTGPSQVTFTIDANGSTLARTGQVVVGGQTISIIQGGNLAPASASCEVKFSLSGSPLNGTGGSGAAILQSTPGCPLSLSTAVNWLSLTATQLSADTQQLSYVAGANTTNAPRMATIYATGTGASPQAFRVLQKAIAPVRRFADVAPEHPFFDYIDVLAQKGIGTFCSPGNFCPEAITTRGEMAVLLVRAFLGTDSFSNAATPYFEDVPASNPYFRYVQKLKELGLTVGCSTTPARYCVADGVTRGQIALFLTRMLYGPSFSYTAKPYFTDVSPANPVFAGVQKLRDLGITSGCTTTEYCEGAPNTRGQIAVFLVRALYSN